MFTPRSVLTATAFVLTLLYFFSTRSYEGMVSQSTTWLGPEQEIERAANASLGFEKVIAIGLKERSDRRDALTLQSSLTGFHVEFQDGVRGEEIVDKAVPWGKDRKIVNEPNMGSWRGHMNAVRSILERNLSSALIMEDDVDWDIRLKTQLPEFAKGARTISNIPLAKPQHSPYGDDWDILWLGHCGEVLPLNDERRYVINNDPTVAPKEHQPWLKALADYPEQTRIIHKTGAPICTFAYAVSYRGAQKLIWAMAMQGFNMAYDNALAYMCRDGYMDIKCVSVQPMLFMHHRPAGAINKDSDIQQGDAEKIREKGFTENIVLSARLNIEKMITGATDYVMQW